MHLADRVNRIEVSSTAAVIAEAEKFKARGLDVVDFGPGEPDCPTPDHIKRAAVRAIEQNFTKYTPTAGILPLREAICAWHKRELASSYEPKECIVNVGGKHAIFNAVSILIQKNDEVIIPAPYWVSFPDIVKFAGGDPVHIQAQSSDNFCVRAAAIEAAITPRTRMVIVNSPGNPTGGVVPPEEFERIYQVCKRREIWLLTDECYSHFVYPPAKPYSVASISGSKPHLIVVGSMSKTFAMTGWRVGYTLAPQPVIDAMIKVQSQSTSNPNSIAQHAALEAMRGSMESTAAMLAEYGRRRARILEGLRAIPGVTCSEPGGAFYAFPNVAAHLANGSGDSPLPRNATDLARQLLEKTRVAVVPGDAFGAPGYLRISYATSMDRIDEGLRRLTRFFSRSEPAS